MGSKRIGLRGSVALAAVAVGTGGLVAQAHADVAASPVVHNGVIAFAAGAGWAEVNPDASDSGGYHVVTPTGGAVPVSGGVRSVVFSPDGGKAAFTPAGCALWVSNADGTGATQLTHPTGAECDDNAAFSNDGRTVFFSRGTIVMSIPTDGSAAEKPVPGVGALVSTGSNGLAGSFAVSPDGRHLAYVAQAARGPALTVVDLVTHAQTGSIPLADMPAFSPDGSQLAVVDYQSGSPVTEIYSVAEDGSIGGTGRTVPGAADRSYWAEATFSPDGTELAFYTPSSSGTGIRIVSVANGQSVTTIDAPGGGGFPAIAWQNGPLYTGPLSSPSPAPDHGSVVRFAGADRIATAIATAQDAYGSKATGLPLKAQTVVLSRDDEYADALAGNALASQKHGPLLLTGSKALDPRVSDEIAKILPKGSAVYLLGGEQALGKAVFDKIQALGYVPRRLEGSDRFSTAVAIAKEISPAPHSVLVATGVNFPDALTAGPAAAQDPLGGVVVLSDGSTLPSATRTYLRSLNVAETKVYGVGGPGVAAASTAVGASKVIPLQGADRYATALAVARSGLFRPSTAVSISTGKDWPDALAGGALSGSIGSPMFLSDTNGLSEGELSWLSGHPRGDLAVLFGFGGPQALPTVAMAGAADAAFGTGGWSIVNPTADAIRQVFAHARF